MALKNYILNGPSTVILFDKRDPMVSWARHIRKVGRGGVDLVATLGTPVLAPTAGVMTHLPNLGSAGNSSLFKHDANPGWGDVFSHLSRYVGTSGQHFNQGEVIAYSGDSGAPGQPHVHRHLLDPAGVRQNPWLYFNNLTPAGDTTKEINMALTNADYIGFLDSKFDIGGGRIVSVKQALSAIYFYGDLSNKQNIAESAQDNEEIRIANVNYTQLEELRARPGMDLDKLADLIITKLPPSAAGQPVTAAQIIDALAARLTD